jgi:hypothetical protein
MASTLAPELVCHKGLCVRSSVLLHFLAILEFREFFNACRSREGVTQCGAHVFTSGTVKTFKFLILY